MSSDEHQQQAEEMRRNRAVRCAVLTISDTRTPATDRGGDAVIDRLTKGGHTCVSRRLVKDEASAIRAAIESWINQADVDVVLTTGGTGIAKRDTTIEVVRGLLTVELDGFGELFRMLSYQEVGASAMMSRAVGGLVISKTGETFLFAMPGSVNAVETAMDRLIVPQLAHLVWERRK